MQTHDEKVIRIDLTVDQQQQLKAAIGKDAQAIELTRRELEQRIVPRIAVNHNETMLDEHFG
jgi:hypothetical protein